MTTEPLSKNIDQQAPVFESIHDVTLENDQVLVIENAIASGESIPMHTHRFPHLFYIVEGGTVEIRDINGHADTVQVTTGQVLWQRPLSHSVHNVGSTLLRILEVEVKSPVPLTGGERVPRITMPATMEWKPDPFDPNREVALLVGDPLKPGLYIVRARVGDAYELGLHLHPTEDENLAVISGALHISTGEPGSGEPEYVLPAGGFVLFPAGTPHRIWTTEATEIQMIGVGPRVYHYHNVEQDPRLMQ